MLHCTRQHTTSFHSTQRLCTSPKPHVRMGGPRLVWYQPWSHHNQTTKPRSCQGQHVFPGNTKPTNKGAWQQQSFPLGHTSAFQTCCLNCHYRFPNNDTLTFNGCTSLIPRPPLTMEGGLGMRPLQQWRGVWEWDPFNNGSGVWEWDSFNNGGRSGNGTPSTIEGGLGMRSLQQWKWGSGNETPSTMEGGLGMRPLQHGQCELQRPRGQGLWWGVTHQEAPSPNTVCVGLLLRHTRPSTIW